MPRFERVRLLELTFRLIALNCVPHTPVVRDEMKKLQKDEQKSEDDLKALQSIGQSIGEVLKQLSEEKCTKKRFFGIPNRMQTSSKLPLAHDGSLDVEPQLIKQS